MKKLMMMAVAGLGLVTAKADWSNQYLSWSFDGATTMTTYTFNYAVIKWVLGSSYGYLNYADEDEPGLISSTAASGNTATDPALASLEYGEITDWSDYSFLVEIYGNNDERIGQSRSVKFANLAPYIYEQMATDLNPYVFKMAGIVPEPTSGMLFLLGLAGLALRRRRV